MRIKAISFASLVVLALVTGCASSKWHQAGKTPEETRADLAQCKKFVKAADVAFTIDSGKTRRELVDACMRMKGYSENGKTNALTDWRESTAAQNRVLPTP